MRMLGVIVAATAVVAWEPRAARACSLFEYNDFVLSSGTDTVAPAVAVAGASVWRGDGSCEGTGLIGLEVSGIDDQTPASQLGYLVRIVRSDGAMFPGLPTTPFNQFNNLSLHFNDHGQPIDVSLQVSAVDRNGNISAPVTVDVVDPGGDSAGCAVGGGASAGWLAVLALVTCAAPGTRSARRRPRP